MNISKLAEVIAGTKQEYRSCSNFWDEKAVKLVAANPESPIDVEKALVNFEWMKSQVVSLSKPQEIRCARILDAYRKLVAYE